MGEVTVNVATVVGSREINQWEYNLLVGVSSIILLLNETATLYTGDAIGSDDACRFVGANFKAQFGRDCVINFVPKEGHRGHTHGEHGAYVVTRDDAILAARTIGQDYHQYLRSSIVGENIVNPDTIDTKKYPKLKEVFEFMTRNVFQIYGIGLDKKTELVICCSTPKAKVEGKISDVEGGTGMAVRIAYDKGIPVYNIRDPESLQELVAFLRSLKGYTEAHDQALVSSIELMNSYSLEGA